MAIFYGFLLGKRRMLSVLLGISILICGSSVLMTEEVLAEESLRMYSGSYALIDGDTNRVLAGKEASTPMANASTTKILTCIVALETHSLEEVVTVSAKAASQPKVRMGIKEGEQHSLKEMLYGLMLESYNDCAVAIAEYVGGSTEGFAQMMNDKAKKIGCKDTYFITPNGLDAEDDTGFHHTTAEDLCRIMAYCTWESPMKEEFLRITQTRNYDSFVNRNAFLNQMDGVLTGKTGFTNKAGYCYVAAMEINGERYCIALLACGWPNNKNYKWKDAKTLFEYGIEQYDRKQITIENIEREIKVNGFVSEAEFPYINTSDVLKLESENHTYQLLMKEGEELECEIRLYTDTDLPIEAGQVMGKCTVYLADVQVDCFDLIAKENAYIWEWKVTFYTMFYQFLAFF